MASGVRLHVWGERACFTRPEMKVERPARGVRIETAYGRSRWAGICSLRRCHCRRGHNRKYKAGFEPSL